MLAVIVILAVIALIAVPIVLNIIEDTKKSATIRSAEMYIHGIEINIINEQLNKKEFKDGQYNIIEFADIEISGEKPIDGMLEVEEGKVIDYSLKIGNYIVNYDRDNNKSIISGEIRKAEPNVEVIEGMIPVQYKDNNWVVVDPSKRDWYDYSNQEWANAVILNSGVTKNIGDTVDVTSEVKGMFVYIPRYEYKIEGQYGKGGTSASNPGEIEINFITKRVTTGSEGYRVHPGFTFGSDELNGIWVGKFETSGTRSNPIILPNEKALHYQNISEQFETSQNFNSYIINGDSHMAKNSEWGAAAYLSQSRYGKYGNPKYEGSEKQIMINNCSNYITGIGADSQNGAGSSITCTTNTYETVKGQAASTTGNITGVYDMSGGALDRTMGVLMDPEGNPRSGNNSNYNSGYTGMLNDGTIYNGKEWPDAKYYDIYVLSVETACDGKICYGHALSEVSNWYGDYQNFVSFEAPFIARGFDCGTTSNAGIFSYRQSAGDNVSHYSFRVVVSSTMNR